MAKFNIHRGSLFGLPDFGITEAISDFLKRPRDPKTGGSQLFQFFSGSVSPKYPFTPTPVPTPTPRPESTMVSGNKNQPQTQPQPQPQYGSQTQTQPRSQSQPSQSQPSQSQIRSQGLIPITEEEALRRGWDFNNLPAGYYAYRPPPTFDERAARVKKGIESAYGDIISTLDQIAGLVPQRQAEEQRRLQEFLQTQTQALGTQKESSLANLGIARQQVEQELGQAKQDIYSSLRNLLQASQQKLGLAGAGMSSAQNVMLPYALGKQAGRSLAQAQTQAMKQFNEIEMKKNDVATTYDLAVNQLQQDYQDRLNEVINRYNNYLDQIRMQKANATQQKKMALAQLELGLMEQARLEAQRLKDFMLQRQAVVEDWARNRLAQLDDFKLQLAQSGQFSPQEIVWSEIQGLGAEMSPTLISQGDYAAALAAMMGRKKMLDELSNQ